LGFLDNTILISYYKFFYCNQDGRENVKDQASAESLTQGTASLSDKERAAIVVTNLGQENILKSALKTVIS
jgi:hypothetical protein